MQQETVETTVPFSWDQYPLDFTSLIFSFLSYYDLTVALQVCHTWHNVGKQWQYTPRFWKDKYLLSHNEFIQVDDEGGKNFCSLTRV
jgi:hypothetical protein